MCNDAQMMNFVIVFKVLYNFLISLSAVFINAVYIFKFHIFASLHIKSKIRMQTMLSI